MRLGFMIGLLLVAVSAAQGLTLRPDMAALERPSVPRLYASLPDADIVEPNVKLEPLEAYRWVFDVGETVTLRAEATAEAKGERAVLTVWDWEVRSVAEQSFEVPFAEDLPFEVEGRGTYVVTLDLFEGEECQSRLVRSFSTCPPNHGKRDDWKYDEFFLGTCAFPGRQHWGNDYGDATPPGLTEQESRDIDAELSARLGLQVVRPDISAMWRGEDQPLDFERCDAALGAWTSRGFKLDLQVGRPPADWTILPMYADVEDPKWRYPKREGPSRRWVAEVVGRYAKDAEFIELYNEPDNRDFWRGTPEEYVEWATWAAEEVRRAAPEATIVNGGYCLIEPEWTGIFARGLVGMVDGVAYHSHGDVDNLSRMLDAMRAIHSAAGYEPPAFVNTEMGYAAWRYDIERSQATTGLQKALYCWAHGNRGALLYCSRGIGGPRRPVGDPDWGYIDFFMCPRFLYGGVSALVDWYAGARFDAVLLETAQKHVYRFRRGDDVIIAAFTPSGGTQMVTLVAEVESCVSVDPMGNATPVEDASRVEVELGGYPATLVFSGAKRVEVE